MTDCMNAEIRDLLPDVLHGSLSPADQARVAEHVAACAECTAELQLLEQVHASYPARQFSASAISRSIAPYSVRRSRMPQYMRIAAGIAILALGGASYNLATKGIWFGKGTVAESTLALGGSDSANQLATSVDPILYNTDDLSALDEQAMTELLSRIETLELEISENPRPLVRSPRMEGGIE